MLERLGASVEGFFVQEMVEDGVDVILGLTSEPSVGSLVAFGLGGAATELLGDIAFRIVPLTDVDAGELIHSIRGYPLLVGYRDRPVTDQAALEDLVLRLSWLAGVAPEIAEMDLNPVRVFATGRGLAVLDVQTAIV
jgi:acetate---CoA ligase (ADP-forming)